MRKVLFGYRLALSFVMMSVAQASTVIAINNIGDHPTFSYVGSTITSSTENWWGVAPSLSTATCFATCDSTPGNLNVVGSLYEPLGADHPFGFNGATIENFINIYEPDGVTLSNTLQLTLREIVYGSYRVRAGVYINLYSVNVQEIFNPNPRGAYTSGSSAFADCVGFAGAGSCHVASMTSAGVVQNILPNAAAGLGLSLTFQSAILDAGAPEPGSLVLLGSALIFLGVIGRKKTER